MTIAIELDKYIKSINSKSPENILKILQLAEPIIENDHFALKCGRHSSTFFQFSRIVSTPDNVTFIAADMIDTFNLSNAGITKLLVPTTAGVFLGWELSRRLGSIPIAFSDVTDLTPSSGIRAGHEISRNDKVLVVNDIMTTGEGNHKLIEFAFEKDAEVIGVVNFASRLRKSIDQLNLGISSDKIFISVELEMDEYNASDCPICKQGKPIRFFIDYN